MDEIFEILNDPANKEKVYFVITLIAVGTIGRTVKKIKDEIKRKK